MMGEAHMQGFGFGGFIMLAIVIAAQVVPFWRILPRAGLPSWMALLTIFPLFTLVRLWVMAFKQWPGDDVGSEA